MIDTVQKLLRTRVDDDTVAVISPDRTWTWREYLLSLIHISEPTRPY